MTELLEAVVVACLLTVGYGVGRRDGRRVQADANERGRQMDCSIFRAAGYHQGWEDRSRRLYAAGRPSVN